ncbi:MAG: efflux RND transporter periplasmic adaptor subunit [Myxococcales bacterium]|nr:efflux RND transporter periplasmic adaptor subunit [Myxococcales bacterium]MCB9609485.1 efflux RND transporter periplasmic adaptor subunit [Polyangiaceae bacterium]
MSSMIALPLRVGPLVGLLLALFLFTGCSDSTSEPSAPGPGADTSAMAHNHESPGETCFICDPAKRDAGRLWCQEHSRYEDRCWLCQPQLEEKGRLYCEEHGLYEDECHLCHPELKTSAKPVSGGGPDSGHSHAASDETCFICDPDKRDAGRLWCQEHSRYEDRCWLCQPQLEEKGRPYCEEHGLYEDECHLCRPGTEKPGEKGEEKSSRAAPHSGGAPELFCNEHQVPEHECGICQPQLAAGLGPGGELKVRFESVHSAAKAGIRTVPARATEAQASVSALCEVSYNENELARITPFASGLLRRVLVDVGADVEAGDVLLELHSAEVASAKSAFISAVVDLNLKEVACKRERRLAERKISSDKEVQEADAACRTAELTLSTTRQRLLNLGFTEEEVETISADQDSSAVLLVRAPYRGTIVERDAVVGEAVSPGDSLLTLANLETMWLSLSVPADRAHLVEAGQQVAASFDGHPGLAPVGELTWVNMAIDERTRMLRARAVVDNSARSLRAGMFGDAQLLVAGVGEAIAVPRGAIQRYERAPYVFVKLEDDLYSLRRVALVDGSPAGEYVAVLSGLAADEPVVAVGAFTVMSEFLKSRLGAGCVDD